MPNPDFTGSVPRMRCETCEHWERVGAGMTRGLCRANTVYNTAPHTVVLPMNSPQSVVADVFHTTDLTVCSNWKKKEE